MSSGVVYDPALGRREQAQDSAQRHLKKIEKVMYRIENDDVLILSGTFSGRLVSELWQVGPDERDYIFMNLVKVNPEVKKIVAKLCK